ncbi:MAG: hypothetical protein HYZ09_04365 [Candidatus Kerfeldbacteria bacterium]|nr:hypothetical protein [Candidatus Kerfeldbacteria bacterium]
MRRVLAIIVIALVVALAGVALVFIRNRGASDRTNANGNTNTAVAENTNTTTTTVPPPSPEELVEQAERDAIRALAILVAERYGSYSSATITAVPDSLAAFVVDAAVGQIQQFVRQEQPRLAASDQALGYTTRALSSNVVAYTAGASATIRVGTQREEQVERGAPTLTRPTLTLELVKQGDDWKVQSLAWEAGA